jgi:hypothetical protein
MPQARAASAVTLPPLLPIASAIEEPKYSDLLFGNDEGDGYPPFESRDPQARHDVITRVSSFRGYLKAKAQTLNPFNEG